MAVKVTRSGPGLVPTYPVGYLTDTEGSYATVIKSSGFAP